MAENAFTPRTFSFDLKTSVSVTNESVMVTTSKGKGSIEAKNIDSFFTKAISEPKITPIALVVRLFVFGFIMLFFVKEGFKAMIFDASPRDNFIFWLAMSLMLIAVLGFFLQMFDSIMRLGIYSTLLTKYYSNKGFKITIGNKSGNNLEFVVFETDSHLVRQLEEKLNELKIYYSEMNKETVTLSELSDLHKLVKLLKEGIITEEEFGKMKARLIK